VRTDRTNKIHSVREDTEAPLLIRALRREPGGRVPIWLMRQAGRYLPEYRALREKTGSFLDLCYSPEQAAEATLQPVRRFDLDAAILFSDILVVPDAMGQSVRFATGEGPVLEALADRGAVDALVTEGVEVRLAPVYEAARLVRAALPAEQALIGFAGAPWTVATYMIEGGSSRDFARAKGWAARDPEGFDALLAKIEAATLRHLLAQVRAGVQALQIFDSWAGVLDEIFFERLVIAPTRRLVAGVRAEAPDVPIIGFPKGSGVLYARYAAETGVDAVSLDPAVPLDWAASALQARVAVQGNLDPILLLTGGQAMARRARQIAGALSGGPFVFNLGHGVLPPTPPDHVAELIAHVREATES
jgi:uroporphyrinogen decarboxylase